MPSVTLDRVRDRVNIVIEIPEDWVVVTQDCVGQDVASIATRLSEISCTVRLPWTAKGVFLSSRQKQKAPFTTKSVAIS